MSRLQSKSGSASASCKSGPLLNVASTYILQTNRRQPEISDNDVETRPSLGTWGSFDYFLGLPTLEELAKKQRDIETLRILRPISQKFPLVCGFILSLQLFILTIPHSVKKCLTPFYQGGPRAQALRKMRQKSEDKRTLRTPCVNPIMLITLRRASCQQKPELRPR